MTTNIFWTVVQKRAEYKDKEKQQVKESILRKAMGVLELLLMAGCFEALRSTATAI